MRVLVYPNTSEIGGSQLNAVELAGAVRDRGHDVLVLAEDGPLLERVAQLGLERVPLAPRSRRPSPAVMRQLCGLVASRGIDVVHGYEWPPALEAFFGPRLRHGTPCVTTVMSMAVAPFVPGTAPLVVGTAQIRAAAQPGRRAPTVLIEPPVDVEFNRPGPPPPDSRAGLGVSRDSELVVVVSRLAAELKLEGLLTAMDLVGDLAPTRDVQLLIVGDGPARDAVAVRAQQVNERAGRAAVVLAGALADPRSAYAVADVVLGMGGSALRAMAFAKPVVVQGERGYFKLLSPETVSAFLDQGWYGVGDGTGGPQRLAAILTELLDSPIRRDELGAYARRLVVDRFSLVQAAAVQEAVYVDALAGSTDRTHLVEDIVRTSVRFAGYKIKVKAARLRGAAPADDSNALAVVHRLPAKPEALAVPLRKPTEREPR